MEQLAHSKQPLVPERVFLSGAGNDGASTDGGAGGLLGMLIGLLVAEKAGFEPNGHRDSGEPAGLKEIADRLTREAMASLQQEPPAVARAVR